MELVEANFSGGVAGAFGFVEAECKRVMRAREAYRESDVAAKLLPELAEAAHAPVPLWQRISGLDMKTLEYTPPGSLRAGIRRLLRVVENLFRAELKTADIDDDGGPEKLSDGSVSYAGRSPFWDPLPEICNTLGIVERRLSALCKLRTGLKIRELCDAIRCERLRGTLKEKFTGLMKAWRESMGPREIAQMSDDFEGSGHRFLKWMRGGGRGETRKGLACSLGLTSRERLDRAAFVLEKETLEKIEVEVAMEVIRAMFGSQLAKGQGGVKGAGEGAGASQGACSDEVDNPWVKEYPGSGRFDNVECPPEKGDGD